jgi:thiol-disulfide isomerase/thioredoxin
MKHIILIFIFLIYSFSGYSQLPSVSLKDTEGNTINTNQLNNGGKPYIISFFALWCKPCLRELNAINELYDEWQKETGVKLIVISIDEGQNAYKVAPAINGHGWSFEVLLDTNREFMRALNVTLIPCLLIVDGKNKIVLRKSSYSDGTEIEIIKEIRKILKN